jgi:uncharacterized OsmC-like protein
VKVDKEALKTRQAPLKAKYKEDPRAAFIVLKAAGSLDQARLACTIERRGGPAETGLHPLAGGDGTQLCSGDMLLEALAGCAGVTLVTVATAMGIVLRGGKVRAEGDLDFRGTLGVDKETPVGFTAIRLAFDLETDATEEQLASLSRLTERYCVVAQTLKLPVAISVKKGS